MRVALICCTCTTSVIPIIKDILKSGQTVYSGLLLVPDLTFIDVLNFETPKYGHLCAPDNVHS